MAKEKFLICMVLDETGSMYPIKSDTIGGYNKYVDSLRDQLNTKMLLVRFNSNAISVGEIEPIKDAVELTEENYNPQATTPLYDAIGKAISKIDELKKNRNIIFVILTDGLENASREYTRETIFNMIKERDNWQFVYLGANQDAFVVGGSLGVPMASTMTYTPDKIAQTLNVVSSGTQRYMSNTSKHLSFNDNEREKVK